MDMSCYSIIETSRTSYTLVSDRDDYCSKGTEKQYEIQENEIVQYDSVLLVD
jgi:hypothetical protein